MADEDYQQQGDDDYGYADGGRILTEEEQQELNNAAAGDGHPTNYKKQFGQNYHNEEDENPNSHQEVTNQEAYSRANEYGNGSGNARVGTQGSQNSALDGEGKIPNKIFVGGISWSTSEDGLKNYFSKFGPVESVDLMRSKMDNQPRGFAFVTFKTSDSVKKACDQHMHDIDGKQVEVKYAFRRNDERAAPGAGSSATGGPKGDLSGGAKLFVGGITPDTKEHDLEEYFSQWGKMIGTVVMMDQATNRGRGFGFVTYETAEEADRCLAVPEHTVLGKHVDVKVYKAKPVGGRDRGDRMGFPERGHGHPGGYGSPQMGGYGGQMGSYGGYGGQMGAYGGYNVAGYGSGPGRGGYGAAASQGYGAGYGGYGMDPYAAQGQYGGYPGYGGAYGAAASAYGMYPGSTAGYEGYGGYDESGYGAEGQMPMQQQPAQSQQSHQGGTTGSSPARGHSSGGDRGGRQQQQRDNRYRPY